MDHDLTAQHRLAVYGTLAPGRPNEHILADVDGDWSGGTVRGHLHDAGWGAASGYPGIVLDADGSDVTIHLFTSNDLPQHWARLDEFEGPGYARTTASVSTPGGSVEAYIYALATTRTPTLRDLRPQSAAEERRLGGRRTASRIDTRVRPTPAGRRAAPRPSDHAGCRRRRA